MRDISDKFYYSFALLILGMLVATVMFTEAMLTPALPIIQAEFGVSGILASWILPVVLLVGAAVTPIIGRLGDYYGKKQVLIFCLVIYTGGVFCGGFAWDIYSLLFFRAMQGLGLGVFPLAYALVMEQFPEEKVPTAIGTIAATFGAGTFLGVFIGSWITSVAGWRMTYHVMSPVVLLLVAATVIILRPSPRHIHGKIDFLGAFALSATLLGLILALSSGGQDGWESPHLMPFVAITLISGAVFIWREKTSRDPVINPALLRQRSVCLVNLLSFMVVLVLFMILQALPYLIENPAGLALSEFAVGLILMPGSIADMVAGPLTGVMVRRYGVRRPLISGAVLLFSGAAVYFVGFNSISMLVLAGVLMNAGMSVELTANTIIMLHSVPEEETAAGTALIQTSQNVGGMTGPVITGIIISGFTAVAFGSVFLVATVFAAMVVIMTLFVPNIKKEV